MSNNTNNPYDEFLKRGKSNEEPEPTEEFTQADRGQPELKVDKSYSFKDNKNMIIAGVVVLFTLLIVILFISIMVSKVSGTDEPVSTVVDGALSKVEHQDITNLKSKIDRENERKEAALNAERDRIARLAQEQAERERLARERSNPTPVEKETSPKLGRFESEPTSNTVKPRSISESRNEKPEDLTPYEIAMMRKTAGDVLGYQSPVKSGSSESGSQLEQPSTLGNMLVTERFKNGTAYLRPSRDYLLMRGTNIACTLLPRVVTNYPSQPQCMVNEDVYSPEGIVLVERGSKVLGEQRVAMKSGIGKVFVAWADIETPAGVSINIDSMGADQLGGSGLDAWIDNHYPQRFGGAILLSFIDDFFEILANKASKTEYNFEASSDNASSMAQIVLENTINIEPTGYIMPAQQINIIVARDVDFTHIYKVY